ncbi:MAG: HD family phosphohydrolase [Longimicrobiales bacterium]
MQIDNLRAFFATLSGPPERAWPDAVQHHGARVLLLLSLAFITYLFFPVAVVPDFPQLERGMVVDEDIIAQLPFQVPKPESQMMREREAAAGAVAPIFRYDSLAVDTMRARVARFLTRIDSAFASGLSEADAQQRLRAALNAYALPGEPDPSPLLAPRANRMALRRSLLMTVNTDMRAGVATAADLEQSPSMQVRIMRNGADQLTTRDAVMTGRRLRELAVRNLPMDAPAALGEFQRLVLLSLFVPSLRFDRVATEALREAARRAVPTVKEEFVAGERVIFSHERLQDDDVERLRAYQTALATAGRLEPERNRWMRITGMLLLNLLELLILGFLLYQYRRPVYESLRAVLLLSFLFLTVVAAAALLASAQAPAVLVPIALPALVAAVLWDGRLALVYALVIALLITMQAPYGELSPRILFIAGGAAAALSVRVMRRRAHGLILGAVVALAYAGASLAVGLLLSWELSVIASGALLGSANGIACALIAVGLMPVFEAWTGITTDQTLLELSDLNGPLLKRLSLEASGTYAHSINVANLAEAAARAIDANPLLCRVGAYYHDIGKMTAPQFFVENQPRGRNPHDRLDPATSASIVRNHVLEGLKMADQAKLPEVVKRFIPEHHGTQIIGFFLEEAKRRNGEGPELDVADFRYPGPLPRSRETAVLMLADSVESATKVLDEPTPEKIRATVDRIVGTKLERGQLDEAPLTLQDLARIKQQFVVILSGMYHHRLDYPAAVGISRESGPGSTAPK